MIISLFNKLYANQPHVSQRSGWSRVLTLLSQAHNMPMQIHSELRECVKQTSALGLSSNELGRAEKRWRPQGHHHRGFFCLLENCMNSHQFSSRPKSLSPVASWRCLTTLTALSPHVPVLHASKRKMLASMVRAMVFRPFMVRRAIFPINGAAKVTATARHHGSCRAIPGQRVCCGARHPILRNCRNHTKRQ